ncbi:hypothetical protein [Streptomyces sp. NPDC003023]|uniref:hypothetical protein n=1 Tax=Streptomyces sp. NPDC003023 TaxID=3364675 RepID=UPI00369DE8DF
MTGHTSARGDGEPLGPDGGPNRENGPFAKFAPDGGAEGIALRAQMSRMLGELAAEPTGCRSLVALRVDELDGYREEITRQEPSSCTARSGPHDGPQPRRPPHGAGRQPGRAPGMAGPERMS